MDKDAMIALLQQRLVTLQENEKREEETEAHRLELEEKVCGHIWLITQEL